MKVIAIALLFMSIVFSACSQNERPQNVSTAESNGIEVLYFHGKQRCATCIAIEKQTKQAVEELSDNRLTMRTIDISKKENESIVEKYEVAWSSLIVVKDGNVLNLTELGFSLARNNPDGFRERLKSEIKQLLK
ncbi:MAG: thioredoxin [Bacteroidales bacterium]|jgi:thioredoxin-related protein|nr:thioredoxin [Bacteroidales bacterium]